MVILDRIDEDDRCKTMDKKIIAVAIVAVIVIAAAGAFIIMNNDDDVESGRDVAAIARVNTDGSGIYLKAGLNPADFYTQDASGKITLVPAAWGGKVFGTPGTSTIQHVQLQTLVEQMGLKFEKYVSGYKKTDTVYYSDSINNATAAIEKAGDLLDGGILWEPQYSLIASNEKYQEFLTTNELFPGHTCCLIAGSEKFMTENPEATVAFLAAYVEAVKFINVALADTNSDEYKQLVDICVKYTSGLTEDVIKDALSLVVYKFSDDNKTGSLDDLKKDLASLESSLEDLGTIQKKITDLGFKNSTEFANAFVDDSYLSKAVSGDIKPLESTKKITVSAISGDIHQIGVRVAQDLGLFEKYNLDVTVNGVGNGPAVAKDLLGNQADFGFIGAPPLTANVVNGDAIHA